MTAPIDVLDRTAGYPLPGGPDAPAGPAGNGRVVTSTGEADRPNRRRKVTTGQLVELIGSALASVATVWLIFTVVGISAPFGLAIASMLLFFVIYGIVCWRAHGIMAMKDRLASVAVWIGALLAMIPLGAVILYVIVKGARVALSGFPHFFVADMSQLTGESPPSAVGAGAAIVGTVEQVGIATVLTVPLGILTATYLADSRSLFSRVVGYVVDAMTGAPAIIAGLFIYLFWVAPRHHSGKSGLAAGMALAVMMLPVVTRAAQEVVAIVPGSLREAALALGAPQWRVLVRVVLPAARAGIMTAVILGIARIAGETAPVLFNAGGNKSYNWNPFVGQQDNLPFRIYELILQPSPTVNQVAWGVSFVLVLLVLVLFVIARIVGGSRPGRHLLPRLRRSGAT